MKDWRSLSHAKQECKYGIIPPRQWHLVQRSCNKDWPLSAGEDAVTMGFSDRATSVIMKIVSVRLSILSSSFRRQKEKGVPADLSLNGCWRGWFPFQYPALFQGIYQFLEFIEQVKGSGWR